MQRDPWRRWEALVAAGATAWATLSMPLLAAGPRVMSADRMLADVRTLASDAFEGRGPGSRGEDLTVAYLVEAFGKAGLKPGMPDGSWTQEVPIIGVKSSFTAAWTSGGARRELVFPQDIVAWSPQTQPVATVPESDMVFVGHGVTAPEYAWDDYKGFDVRGKTVVILAGDPPVPDVRKPGELDPRMFGGKAMTYYVRWTYKYEEAARRGAAAALLVHETKAAAYPWFVVVNSWGRERFELEADTDPKVVLAGWLSLGTAEELLGANGLTHAQAQAEALRKEFKPRVLAQRFSARSQQAVRRVLSRNVVARLPGSRRPLETVVYSAHWDHLGRDGKAEGDGIYNGAADNAVGVAGLLELARAFGSAGKAPARSVVFLAPTAEEQGLLGARHYARNPPWPARGIVANINIDGMNTWGRTRDVRQVGQGHSSLDRELRRAVRAQGRRLLPDANPERGMFYRSDHFEFLRAGVPALYMKAGDDYAEHPAGYGQQRVNEYIDKDYHKPSDDVKPGWDLGGAAEDLGVLQDVGWRLADGSSWPSWNRTSEFREAGLRRRTLR